MPPKRKSTVKVKTEKQPAKPAARPKKPASKRGAAGDAARTQKKARVKEEPRHLALPPAAATIGFVSRAPRPHVRTGERRVPTQPRGWRRSEPIERRERAQQLIVDWASDESGALTLQAMAEDEPCRFVGERTIDFALPTGPDAFKLVAKLCREVKATNKPTPKRHYGNVVYDKDGESGKPDDGITTTVKRLADHLSAGKLVTDDADAQLFLDSADPSPRKLPPNYPPCMLCLCYVTKVEGPTFTVTIRTYATRALFYLIADESTKVVLNGLTTLAGPVTPCAAPPHQLDLFATSAQQANAAPFTLEAATRSAEHTGCAEDPQPSRIALPMKPYQLQAIRWMREMERLDLNALFWERRAFADGGEYWFAPDLGECRLEQPPSASGGLLCDEMGMGKTIEVVALVCAAAPASAASLKAASLATNEKDAGPLVASRATLIVVPPALVSQWVNEIAKSVKAANPLSVKVFVTDDERSKLVAPRKGAKSGAEFFAARKRSLSKLADHDIVIVTYNTMQAGGVYGGRGDVNALSQVRWTRVVLDEMQMVSSPNTVMAKTCAALHTAARWMVSGTPLTQGIQDLNGELRFLGVLPFSASDATDGFWGHCVQKPWANQDPVALERLELLLRRVALRRSKAQVWAAGPSAGRPILELPPRGDRVVAVDLEPASSEALALRAIDAAVGAVIAVMPSASAGAGAIRELGRHKQLCLEVLRQSCIGLEGRVKIDGTTAEALIDLPKRLQEVCRIYDQRCRDARSGGGLAGAGGGVLAYTPRLMTPGDAIAHFGASDRDQGAQRQAQGAQDREARGGREDRHGVGRENFVGHGNAQSRARATDRQYSTLTLMQRLHETASYAADLEESRLQFRAGALSGCLWWLLHKLALGAGAAEEHLSSDLDDFTDAQRAFVVKRRRRAIARFVIARGLRPADVRRHLAKRGVAPAAPVLERIEALADGLDDEGGLRPGRGPLKVFAWKAAREVTKQAANATAENHLKLITVRELLTRLRSSADEHREQRDAAAAARDTAQGAATQALNDLQQRRPRDDACRKAFDAVVAADVNAYEAQVEAAGAAHLRRTAADAVAVASDARSALHVLQRQRADGALKRLEDEALGHLKRARDGERDYMRALEVLGADATAKQKAAVEAVAKAHAPERDPELVARLGARLAAAGPPNDKSKLYKTWKKKRDAYVKARKAVLSRMPREARAFFENSGSTKIELQARVEQSGLQDLAKLEKGDDAGKCPVCFSHFETAPDSPVSNGSLCYTPCLHKVCLGCAQQQVLSNGVDNASRRGVPRAQAVALANDGRLEAPCPLCRRNYLVRDCVLVSEPPRAAAPSPEAEDEDDDEPMAEAPPPPLDAARPPEWTPHAPKDAIEGLSAPAVAVRLEGRSANPNIPPNLLAHILTARRTPSTKIRRLLRDVQAAIAAGPGEKCVVVSSIKPAVQHTVLALRGAGIDCVSVAKGDSAEALAAAVKKWREDPDCAVFVLHAGAAAAGLTLTAARHLFLLEPFLSVGEEAQAMNRCHRIGQECSVSTTSYFLRGTAEERLIAYRSRETQAGAGGTDALSVLATAGDVKKMPHHKLRYLAGLPAFVEDMSDDDEDDDPSPARRRPRDEEEEEESSNGSDY